MPENPNFKPSPKNLFYQEVLRTLNEVRIPYILGGAYALRRYTGIERDTKDLDIFVESENCPRILDLFAEMGYRTSLLFPHWLGKIFSDDEFVDVIFSSGNGLCSVDKDWFHYARKDKIFGIPVLLCPPEEMIWSKAFIMERDRFDGADIAHIFHECSESLNWERMIKRFGKHWRVLFAHLILYGFIYPSQRSKIPPHVMRQLLQNLELELGQEISDEYCQGTYLSLMQYLIDVEKWGYKDARLVPRGCMTEREIETWTAAFLK